MEKTKSDQTSHPAWIPVAPEKGHVIVHLNHNNADDRPCNLVALKSKDKKDQLITALLGRVRDLEYEEVNRVIKESHDR